MNATRADLDKEEHIQRLQGQCFYGEAITGQQVLLVLAEARHARCCSGEYALPQEEYAERFWTSRIVERPTR
jgi:hypothetical protein